MAYHYDLNQLQYLDQLLVAYDETILKQKKIVKDKSNVDCDALLSVIGLWKESGVCNSREGVPTGVEQEQMQEDPGDIPPRQPLIKPDFCLQYILSYLQSN
mgnify:CR=1 FL=1